MSETALVHKMELRDLESVLRRKLGDQLAVVSYDTEPLIPLGENYCSTILKVRAIVKDSADGAEPRELNLVAKMMPATDYQRQIFDSKFTFRKENFFYQKLLPAYQQLEREFGVGNDEIFDNAPMFYGARSSKLAGDDEAIDDDAVILMQNLKVLGYYTIDRMKGMDEDHAKTSIVVLGRFHALSVAMRHHKPEFFEVIKENSKCLRFEIEEDDVEEIRIFVETMRTDPVTCPYYEDIRASMALDLHEVWEGLPSADWASIIHADCWTNNIMFLQDPDTGRVADVKFVDFQNYLFMSPLRDLVFFLMMNPDSHVMDNKFDELVDLYYDTFVAHLERLGCDVAPFSREKFDARLKIDAFWEFPHIPFMTKIMTTQLKHDDNVTVLEDVIRSTEMSPAFMEKIRQCVLKYAEKGWFSAK
ncbi:uncharacterized protein LOC106639887 [Copidosoma floridanum]|uniref:uncharacterized protein LOC106639887 n=1 Tax=Copidosoma floridanum TaxID=29053 RepID=UPI0006C9A285|nr:uncharacterized protein LOC106639887 [Copidosoma floridanum]